MTKTPVDSFRRNTSLSEKTLCGCCSTVSIVARGAVLASLIFRMRSFVFGKWTSRSVIEKSLCYSLEKLSIFPKNEKSGEKTKSTTRKCYLAREVIFCYSENVFGNFAERFRKEKSSLVTSNFHFRKVGSP